MNSFARRALPVEVTGAPAVEAKFLLGQAEELVGNASLMTMIINIPERVLLTKISKMTDLLGNACGYTLVFHDITEAVSREESGAPRTDTKRQLMKIPTVSGNRIMLVNAASVRCVRAEGHYTWVHAAQGSSFCNLTISDLESRLDASSFLRIHRSYLVNLDFAEQIVRDDGKVTLKLSGGDQVLPVARASVPRLLERLGITEPWCDTTPP